MYELTYNDDGVTQLPSPDLESETTYSGEIEYRHQLPEDFSVTASVFLNATNQNTLGGGLPILTGPGFVTPENAAEVLTLSEAGTR